MMISRSSRPQLTAASIALFTFASLAGAACRRAPEPPRIQLDSPGAAIEVTTLPSATASALASVAWTEAEWQALLRVSVKGSAAGASAPPVSGTYAVANRTLRFTPMFPFDEGRQYDVVLDASRLPAVDAGAPWRQQQIAAIVGRPATARTPTTVVTQIYPSGDVVPANQLRMYLQFSAPMDWRSGYDYVKLLDDRGEEVVDAFLPLDADFWNDDRTRYTVFFDPGRVKRGILPNKQMGRALEAGKRYTLVVKREWRDGHGMPLKEEFRHEFRATESIERGLSMSDWKVTAPRAGTRDPLRIAFPAPLDHGLLRRALGVATDGVAVAGEPAIEAGETQWLFTPRDPWTARDYDVVAFAFLEDLAGNRIGRAFEVDNFERTDLTPEPEKRTLRFAILP